MPSVPPTSALGGISSRGHRQTSSGREAPAPGIGGKPPETDRGRRIDRPPAPTIPSAHRVEARPAGAYSLAAVFFFAGAFFGLASASLSDTGSPSAFFAALRAGFFAGAASDASPDASS